MSIVLANSTFIDKNDEVQAKSHRLGYGPRYIAGDDAEVVVGNVAMSMSDFCDLASYVMTNTNLEVDDPRLKLKAAFDRLERTAGHAGTGSRFILVF